MGRLGLCFFQFNQCDSAMRLTVLYYNRYFRGL